MALPIMNAPSCLLPGFLDQSYFLSDFLGLILQFQLTMAHMVSTRISLRWVPDLPSEPTDTLVFNVGSYFMDLRVLKADKSIDWGMAGIREILSQDPRSSSAFLLLGLSTNADHGSCEGIVKCRWIKEIDSLGPSDPDEGEFTKLPNGDYFETGSMPYAEKGNAVTQYEEVFRELMPFPGPKHAWILQSMDGKTFLGRAAGRFMALSQNDGGGFSARSEEWNEQEGWKTKYAIGNIDGVPSLAGGPLIEGDWTWKVGAKVEIRGAGYVVRGCESLEAN